MAREGCQVDEAGVPKYASEVYRSRLHYALKETWDAITCNSVIPDNLLERLADRIFSLPFRAFFSPVVFISNLMDSYNLERTGTSKDGKPEHRLNLWKAIDDAYMDFDF